MSDIQTVRVGDRIIIANGVDPLSYLDLTTKKVHTYDNRKWWQKLLRMKQRPYKIKLLTNFKSKSTIKTNQGSNLPGKEQ